jgi:hypothetical protein
MSDDRAALSLRSTFPARSRARRSLQHQPHRDFSASDPVDRFVHFIERHDIYDAFNSMLFRKSQHRHHGFATTDITSIKGTLSVVIQHAHADRHLFQWLGHEAKLALRS